MGNVYEISTCENCGEATVIASGGSFTVHRGENVQRALELVEELGIEEAAKQFCGNCGAHKDTHEEKPEEEKTPLEKAAPHSCEFREQRVNSPTDTA